MTNDPTETCTAFRGHKIVAAGSLTEVALMLHAGTDHTAAAQPLVFDDRTGRVIDLDLRGGAEDIRTRYAPPPEKAEPAPRRRGRPRLGVVSREVTLLPRHWDWLAQQPGGASQTLRRLVDQARRNDAGQTRARSARDAAYRFIAAIAGDLPGFEEATRKLFAGDGAGFAAQISDWPRDVRDHALRLAATTVP